MNDTTFGYKIQRILSFYDANVAMVIAVFSLALNKKNVTDYERCSLFELIKFLRC